MARGRRSQIIITLTPQERAHLEHLLRSRSQPTWLHQRVRMVLLRANGVPIVHISTAVGITAPHVYRWLRAWQCAGMTGITRGPSLVSA